MTPLLFAVVDAVLEHSLHHEAAFGTSVHEVWCARVWARAQDLGWWRSTW